MKIEIKTQDGAMDCDVYYPEGAGPWPAVVFYPDGLGVRPDQLKMSQRMATLGYAVYTPNPFYRAGVFKPFEPSTVFSDPAERDRLITLIRSVTQELAMRDLRALLGAIERDPKARKSGIGCVGYCMSGGFALTAAGTFPDRFAAVASFHGARLATEQPDSPHLLAPKMKAEVYVGAAEIDQGFTPAEGEKLKGALDAAGVRNAVEVYPGAKHGFAVYGMPVYDREASERHWRAIEELFQRTLH